MAMPVANLVPNSGTYAWDVPEDLALADDYRLTLTLNDEPGVASTKKCSITSGIGEGGGVRRAALTFPIPPEPFVITLSPSQQRQAKGVDSLRRCVAAVSKFYCQLTTPLPETTTSFCARPS